MTFERPMTDHEGDPWSDKETRRTEGYQEELKKQRAKNTDHEPDPATKPSKWPAGQPGSPEWAELKRMINDQVEQAKKRKKESRESKKRPAA